MSLELFAHPFSSYCQKVLIALYENDVTFDYLNLEAATVKAELANLWPLKRFPVLVDQGRTLIESSTIIEYLQYAHPGPHCLVPEGEAGIEVHMLDRLFDNHVMGKMQEVVNDALRGPENHVPLIVEQAKAKLDTVYAWLDRELAGGGWATPYGFTLADCAAAPSLFYADWTHPIPETYENLRAYRARLLAHPTISRCVEDARPFRPYFPLGAPDRD